MRYSNSSLKAKQDNDGRMPQTAHPPKGLPLGRIVRLGVSEDINERSVTDEMELGLRVTSNSENGNDFFVCHLREIQVELSHCPEIDRG